MKKLISTIVLFVAAILFPIHVYAHSGGTDSKGGHYNRSTGEYHYHHGYSAHQHKDMDGDGDLDCPYEFDTKPNYSEIPKATIDPKLLEEMEESIQRMQELTNSEKSRISPENVSKNQSSDSNKPKILLAAENKKKEKDFKLPEMTFLVPIVYIFLFVLSQIVGLINENLSEKLTIFIFKLILFTLPIGLLLIIFA